MAYRRFRMRRHPGLHGQRLHRSSARGRFAGRRARAVYRRSLRMPKRLLAKSYANTVGQIAYREYPRRKPMHGRRVRYGRMRRMRRY